MAEDGRPAHRNVRTLGYVRTLRPHQQFKQPFRQPIPRFKRSPHPLTSSTPCVPTRRPLRSTSRLRPHPRRPRPRKTPANSQPAWHRNPAPAVRHNCRTPNQIESFSPVGPASSRKRAIRYRSSTELAFAFASACHHQRLVPPAEQMPKLPVPQVEPRRVRPQKPPHSRLDGRQPTARLRRLCLPTRPPPPSAHQ
jgi:hypothetical protein